MADKKSILEEALLDIKNINKQGFARQTIDFQ